MYRLGAATVFTLVAGVATAALAADASPAQPQSPAPSCGRTVADPATAEYLSFVKEPDLSDTSCDTGRETYRVILYEFHLATQVMSFRLDVKSDGRAEITSKKTDTVMMGATPSLTSDRSRALSDGELAVFKQKFEASNFWTLETVPPDMEKCIPNGVEIVEAVREGHYHDVRIACGSAPTLSAFLDEVSRLAHSLDP